MLLNIVADSLWQLYLLVVYPTADNSPKGIPGVYACGSWIIIPPKIPSIRWLANYFQGSKMQQQQDYVSALKCAV